MFLFLLILLAILFLIEILFNYNERARIFKKIPGPKMAFIFGNALEIIVSPVVIMRLIKKYGEQFSQGIYRHWSFPFGLVNIYNPDDVEVILSNIKYSDKSVIYTMIQPWLRDGLLLSNGEKWQKRRKLLTPAFHFNILRHYYIGLQENSQRLVDKLEKCTGERVNLVPVISEYTLHSICETAMGTQLSNETGGARSYKQAVYNLGEMIIHRLMRFYLFPSIIFYLSETGRTTRKLVNIVQNFTKKVIVERMEYVSKYGVQINDCDLINDVYKTKKIKKIPMLDLLLMAEKEGHIDALGIHEEVDTFMFEGHDTTAAGLTFCLMSLANNKNIQNKIFIELEEIFGDSTRPASIEDLAKMKYLECCIKESMRMYPPVFVISRIIHEPVQLSGYTVPANTTCNVQIMLLHRNPTVYKDPLVFDPDRFLPENCVGRHPYAYVPFSAGPRNCIGQKFAMMEMKSAVSEILRKFHLEPITRHEDIEFTADLVLRNVGPIYISFVRRQNK